MQRKTAAEQCERLRDLEGHDLKRQCLRFVQDHAAAIASARPEIPLGLNDRAGDIWEPLFALADLAGGPWPEKARVAAAGLAASAQESSPIGSLLLDILVCFIRSKSDRLHSRELVDWLMRSENRPWAEMRNGKPVNDAWLAQQLKPYGIRPRSVWIDGVSGKGYLEEDFEEVFRRYIPRSEVAALRTKTAPPAETNSDVRLRLRD